MHEYGLGLILSFTDNASKGIQDAVNALDTLNTTASKTASSLDTLASLQSIATLSNNIGGIANSLGEGIINTYNTAISKVEQIGSTFWSLRTTLTALEGDATKAEESINKLVNFAATTPFELSDLTGMYTTIIANKLDAFKELTGATTGIQQNLLSSIGDLMMFRSDVPMTRWAIAIRNAFSGKKLVLQNALDVNVEEILGRKWGDTAEQVAQDFIDLADAMGIAGMMGGSMDGSLSMMKSNIGDIVDQFWLLVADSGAFERLTEKVSKFSDTISETFTGERGEKFASVFSNALEPFIGILEKATSLFAEFLPKFIDFLNAHPNLVKMASIFAMVSGGLLFLSGKALFAVGSLAQIGASFAYLASSGAIPKLGSLLKGLGGNIRLLIPKLGLLALKIGALYFAWKTDLFGIRTKTVEIMTKVSDSFKKASEAVSGSLSDIKKIVDEYDKSNSFFDGLTLAFTRLMVLGNSLVDVWGDWELSEDNFQKAKELGLLPLIEGFLDFQYRLNHFVIGFKNGVNEIVEKSKELAEGIGSAIQSIVDKLPEGDLKESLGGIASVLSNGLTESDVNNWVTIGEVVGKLVIGLALLTTVVNVCVGAFKVIGVVWGAISTGVAILGIVKTLVVGFFGTIMSWGSAVILWLKVGFSSLVSFVAPLFAKIGAVISAIGAPILAIVGFIASVGVAVSAFVQQFQGGFNLIKTVIMVVGIALAAVFAVILGAPALIAAIVAGIVAAISIAIILIKDNWDSICSFFKTAFDKAASFVKGAIEGIKSVFDKVMSFVSGLLDGVASFFGKKKTLEVETINTVTTTGSSVPTSTVTTTTTPTTTPTTTKNNSISWNAKGGVFNEPSIIGVGEDGAEAVVPLQKNTGWINSLSNKISGNISPMTSVGKTANSNVSSGDSMGILQPSNSGISNNTTDIDNSITFSSGSIIIQAKNSSSNEAEKLAEKLMKYIQRKQEVKTSLAYGNA